MALGSLLPSLFPTSDSFTAGRPWEKSLRRRNSSQFGQCKALKASSIVFLNAALAAVVIILHNTKPQKITITTVAGWEFTRPAGFVF